MSRAKLTGHLGTTLPIANADVAAYAYIDAAIDQAHRAVQEIFAVPS